MDKKDEEIEILDLDLPILKENKITPPVVDKVKEEPKHNVELNPIPLKIKNNEINVDKESLFKLQSTLYILVALILLIASIILISDLIKTLDNKPSSNIVEVSSSKETFITGSYKTSNDSLFTFNEDGTFYWFDNYTDLDNNYYSGTYTYLRGTEALNEMGYTEEDITDVFGEDILLDNIYSIKIHPTSAFKNNRNVTKKELTDNTNWWYILVLKDEENAIGYNKTIDARYTLTRK